MTNHYVFVPQFCHPASGWEKGQVEKNVPDARPRLWLPIPNFPDLAALNAWLEQRCMELLREIPHGALPGTIADVWTEELFALMPLPQAFDGFVEKSRSVSPTCLISFGRRPSLRHRRCGCAGRWPERSGGGLRDPTPRQS
jgi:hypothetical protein